MKISKSKLWNKMLDNYRLNHNNSFIIGDYKKSVSYQLLLLQYRLKVLRFEILEILTFGLIIKLED